MLLTGCAAAAPQMPPAPVVVGTAECPAPETPVLPALTATLPLDSPENVAVFLERDDLCRQYIQGLRATVRCYEAQRKEH